MLVFDDIESPFSSAFTSGSIILKGNLHGGKIKLSSQAFSQKHFVKLARYTDKITFILDSDEAGRLSAKRIYSKFINRGLKLRFLEAPYPYKDIDEYLTDKTKEDFYREFKQIIPEQW